MAAHAELGEDFTGFELENPDGTRTTVREILAHLDADRTADDALDTCLIDPAVHPRGRRPARPAPPRHG